MVEHRANTEIDQRLSSRSHCEARKPSIDIYAELVKVREGTRTTRLTIELQAKM